MTGLCKSVRGSRAVGVEPEVGRDVDASNSNVDTLKADGGRPSRALLRLNNARLSSLGVKGLAVSMVRNPPTPVVMEFRASCTILPLVRTWSGSS